MKFQNKQGGVIWSWNLFLNKSAMIATIAGGLNLTLLMLIAEKNLFALNAAVKIFLPRLS
jgi:hypothetical protein